MLWVFLIDCLMKDALANKCGGLRLGEHGWAESLDVLGFELDCMVGVKVEVG